jgi:hypothetical protein
LAEIFHIYASHGRNNYVELDFPASDHEMLDMMERLRLEPGKLPYVEVLKIHETYDYLDKCIREQPDIYQLNALARKLSEFTSVQEMAAFEGLVGMEIGKSAVTIEIPRLIDFAHSTDCCVVAADAMTDFQLGKFLVENGFIEDTNGLTEAALALLDYGKIGREHRERENSVYTSFGYVERQSEIHCVSKTKITPPPVYAIWAEARADGPLAGQAGYLAENGERLFFVQRAEAELKIADLRNSCLNRQPAARYRCVDYFNSRIVASASFPAISSLGLVIALRQEFRYTWRYKSRKGAITLWSRQPTCAPRSPSPSWPGYGRSRRRRECREANTSRKY